MLSNLGTEQLQEKDNHYVHPWEGMRTYGHNKRTIIKRAEGVYFYDSDGNRLLDGPGGMWCVNIGYGRAEMADAIRDQALEMPYASPWSLGNEPAAVLAAKLVDLSPGDLNNVFLTNSGSTAADSALRFVMFYNNVRGKPEKKHILSRNKAYHGSTFLAASVSGKERDKSFMDFKTDTVHFLSDPDPFQRPDGMAVDAWLDFLCREFEEKIQTIGADNCAAFIGEPLLASGGVSIPPKGYHRRILDICHKHDMLYISDEVVTAWGRLGHWFASQDVFDIKPDILTTAKGLTSGYQPLGAMFIADDVMARVTGEHSQDAYFSNGFTYSGHPVACAAAIRNIEIMENENILENARVTGAHMQARLQELRDIPLVSDVRGMGLLGCVECAVDRDADDLASDADLGERIDRHCQQKGLLLRPLINMCVFSPPCIISLEQVDDLVDTLRYGIEQTLADLRREGTWRD